MKHEINIAVWKRKEHFEFFNKFDEPLFGITVKVDCAKAYIKSKEALVTVVDTAGGVLIPLT